MNDYKNGAQFFSSFKLSFVIIFESPGTDQFGSCFTSSTGCTSLVARLFVCGRADGGRKSAPASVTAGLFCAEKYFTLLMIMRPCRCIGVELYFSEYFVFVLTNFSSPFCLFSHFFALSILATFKLHKLIISSLSLSPSLSLCRQRLMYILCWFYTTITRSKNI